MTFGRHPAHFGSYHKVNPLLSDKPRHAAGVFHGYGRMPLLHTVARVAKLADARDLKSRVPKGTYRFNSGPGHQTSHHYPPGMANAGQLASDALRNWSCPGGSINALDRTQRWSQLQAPAVPRTTQEKSAKPALPCWLAPIPESLQT